MRGLFYLHIYINGIRYYYNTSNKLSVRGKVKVFKHIYYAIRKATQADKERNIDYAMVCDKNGKTLFSIDNRGKDKMVVCNVISRKW